MQKTRRPPKCSLCGVRGHNCRKCPTLVSILNAVCLLLLLFGFNCLISMQNQEHDEEPNADPAQTRQNASSSQPNQNERNPTPQENDVSKLVQI